MSLGQDKGQIRAAVGQFGQDMNLGQDKCQIRVAVGRIYSGHESRSR